MQRTPLQAEDQEVMQPITLVAEDFPDAAGEEVAQNYQFREVNGENPDPTSASGLNHVLLGFGGPEDLHNEYLGLNIQPAGIPLTNTNGEFGGTGNGYPDLQTYQVQEFDNHLPAGEVPGLQPHQMQEFKNHLPAGEVTMQTLHGIDDTSRTRPNFQESKLIQNQLQQEAHDHLSSVDQQYHQHMFHQLVDQQQPLHSQQMLSHGSTRANHNLEVELHKLQQSQNRNHYNVGLGDGTYLTSWEESVKCIERFRQLQEQQLIQQLGQQPIHQQPMHDQSSMNNVQLQAETSNGGCGQMTEFNLFGPLHGNFPREEADPNTLYTSGTYSSGLSMSRSTTRPALGLSAAGCSFSVHPAGSTLQVYSCHNPGAGANPFGYPLVDVNSRSHLLNVSGIQHPGITYLGPPNQPMNFNSISTTGSGPCSELLNQDSAHSSSARSSSLDLPLKSGYAFYQGNNIGGNDHLDSSGGPLMAGRTAGGYFPRDMQLHSTKRVKTGVGKVIADLEPRPPHQFATERQRREHLNEKYQTLRSLVPNPTKPDRASIVADAINRIHELKKELETLMAKKRDREERRKKREAPVGERGTALDGSNRHLQGHTTSDTGDTSRDLRATSIKKTSEHGTEVTVRIINNEVELNVKQKLTPSFFLRVVGTIEVNLNLKVLESNGARIQNYNVYRLTTSTVTKDSNNFINFIAAKLLEAVDVVF
ncbi:hypothetical protein R1sor_010572 [Riccia sorocarpa]|uniref:BHLH domain-containing protein n=1 Tax=Riccia sorocarpa TaxID=122646 RepID=A0ABD3HZU3_9MARC